MEPGVLRDGRVQLHPQRHARQLTLQLFQVYSFGSYKHVPVPGIAYPTRTIVCMGGLVERGTFPQFKEAENKNIKSRWSISITKMHNKTAVETLLHFQ